MLLTELLKNVKCQVHGRDDIDISDIKNDSRKVQRGDLFFCISGYETDGHKYAKSAVEKGASCIVVTQLQEDIPGVTQALVYDDRQAMAEIAANFYDHPADKMKMVGITGTNGKTTTTYMIKSIAEKAGYKVGLIGTIKNMIGDEEIHTERTTPESLELQKLLKEMYDKGCDMVVMEVSSHSLCLARTHTINFDVGMFSNLTQDHLDFHKTWENYVAAKQKLFEQSDISIINADDDCAAHMMGAAKAEVVTYGIQSMADITAKDIEMIPAYTKYTARVYDNEYEITVNIPGAFSVYNSLCALSAAHALGIDKHYIIEGLRSIKGVDGRFQSLPTNGDYHIILDYAHTPDSLLNALETIKEFAKGRIVTVFGCGGNRDKGKRPQMAKIAADYSDFTIVTSDNPRFEVPSDIIDDIIAGIPEDYKDYIRIENRRDAIKYAIEHAKKDDIILLAGKGHETYQEIKGVKHDFDEKKIVAQIIKELTAEK